MQGISRRCYFINLQNSRLYAAQTLYIIELITLLKEKRWPLYINSEPYIFVSLCNEYNNKNKCYYFYGSLEKDNKTKDW